MKNSATKIASGEWEFKGFAISKDDWEGNLWWAVEIVPESESNFRVAKPAEDFWSLKAAKEWINSLENSQTGEAK